MFDTHTDNNMPTSLRSKGRALTALLILTIAFVAAPRPAQAQGTTFMYQGRLTDAGASANGLYDLEFKLYNAAGTQTGAALTREDVQVTDGVFTVQLDFGQPPFATVAANTLEIGVRAGASTGAFTALAPRQPLTSSPYAIQTINAAQLGGVPASQYVKTDDPRLTDGGPPAPGSTNYIQNTPTQQANARFNIGGNGIVGGSVGIGTTPASDIRLQIDGNTLMTTGAGTPGNRYRINFGSPNTETGMTLIKPETGTPTGRADLRFDGSTLKLVASTGGIPSPTNGIVIDTSGFVGIGTVTPQAKLDVLSSVIGGTGVSSRSSGTGVFGYSGGGFGVVGRSDGGNGVDGNSNGGNGVVGRSERGTGVWGVSQTGYAARFQGNVSITNGSVGIGTQSPLEALHVAGGAVVRDTLFAGTLALGPLRGFSGTPVCITTGRSYNSLINCSSSLRYKTDLLPFTGGLDIVNRLRPISYKWKADGTPDLGFGAEDVAAVEPLFTFRNDKDEIEGVRYDRLSVVFVNAFKEQQAQMDRQQKQIDELKKLLYRANPRQITNSKKRNF